MILRPAGVAMFGKPHDQHDEQDFTMSLMGRIESLWRYPVKGMRGEALDEAFVGFSGIYGDRIYAFKSSAAPAGLLFYTAREREVLLLYAPRYADAAIASKPPYLAKEDSMAPGMTPLYPPVADLKVNVTTPDGEVYPVDSSDLLDDVTHRAGPPTRLSLMTSERALTDCRPVSIFAMQTATGLASEIDEPVDKRQFRANIYADCPGRQPFFENELLGARIKVGDKAEFMLLELDARCRMITLNPDTAKASPKILSQVRATHDGFAGLYAVVLVEGLIKPNDPMVIL